LKKTFCDSWQIEQQQEEKIETNKIERAQTQQMQGGTKFERKVK